MMKFNVNIILFELQRKFIQTFSRNCAVDEM